MSKKNKTKYDPRIQEIISIYDELTIASNKRRDEGDHGKSLDAEAVKKGSNLTSMVTKDPDELPMTPLLKNAMIKFGDIKDGERIRLDAPITKAETYIIEGTMDFLKRHNLGTDKPEYDRSLPILDERHLLIDIVRNFGKMGREVTPDVRSSGLKSVDGYRQKLKYINYKKMLLNDVLFRRAVQFILTYTPRVYAVQNMQLSGAPFMTKHTNVGYGPFANDKTINPETGRSYAQGAMDTAHELSGDQIKYFPAGLLVRKQRKGFEITDKGIKFKLAKARAVFNYPRLMNLQTSRLMRPLIDAYKENFMFWTFLPAKELKIKMLKSINAAKSLGLQYDNFDTATFDQTVSLQDQLLRGAIKVGQSSGALAKKIAFDQTLALSRCVFINENGKPEMLEGRQPSGVDDTPIGDGLINAIKNVYVILKQDAHGIEKATRIINMGGTPISMLGDDIGVMTDPKFFDKVRYSKDLAELNFSVHTEKGEFGAFLLQHRLAEIDGKVIMTYAFPRIISKEFGIENPQGLGPCGGTMASWNKLYNIIEDPRFNEIVQFLAQFDKYKFGHVGENGNKITLAQFKSNLKKEDALASAEQGRRAISTAERLFDGDPSKVNEIYNGSMDGGVVFRDDYMTKMGNATKKAIYGQEVNNGK